MRGEPLHVIGEILGHRTEVMTKRYAHLSPQYLQNAAEQVSYYIEEREPKGVLRFPSPEELDTSDEDDEDEDFEAADLP